MNERSSLLLDRTNPVKLKTRLYTGEGAEMKEREELLQRITVNPAIFQGKPIIRGMRIKVENVLALLEQGVTVQDILEDYPELEPDDIRACIAYARHLVANEDLSAVRVEAAQ